MHQKLLGLCFLVGGCGVGIHEGGDDKGRLADHTLPSPAQSSQAILGKGYDVEQERFAGDCASGTVQYVGAQESALRFDRSLSEKEIADSLGFSIGTKARYGVFTMSAAADFATSTASDSYSESTVYAAHYKFKNAKLAYEALSPVGGKAAGGGGQGSYVWDNWTKTCGHEFVEQIELGAKLFISAKIEFASSEDKMNFAAKFKIKGPAFSASAELEKASRSFGKSAAVYIQAFQLGGDVRQLSRIFGGEEDATVKDGEQRVHALLVCSMSKIDACTRVLNHAIRYATDLGNVHSFPNQIKAELQPIDAGGPAQLAYVTKPWSDLALYAPPPLIDALVKEARRQVSVQWEGTLKLKRRIESLITGPFRLTAGQRLKIEAAQTTVASNMHKIYDTAMLCYNEPEQCVASAEALQGQLGSIQTADLTILPESFAQWCDAYQANVLKRSLSDTIKLLLEVAATDVDLSIGGDRCATAEVILGQLKSLDLSQRQLADISVLAALPRLELLNLNGNTIADITPLAGLTSLRHLYLNKNLLNDLRPLATLPHLQTLQASANLLSNLPVFVSPVLTHLRAADNKIASLASLEAATALRELIVSGNRISDLTALRGHMQLQELDVAHNRIGDFSPLLGLPALSSIALQGNRAGCPLALQAQCGVLDD